MCHVQKSTHRINSTHLGQCLEAKKFEYSNRVAYVLKCTVRCPVVFYLWRQRASAELRTCIPSLPPHPNSYSRNIAYLVSSLLEVLLPTIVSTRVLTIVGNRTSSKSVERRFLGKRWCARTRAY